MRARAFVRVLTLFFFFFLNRGWRGNTSEKKNSGVCIVKVVLHALMHMRVG